MRADSGMTILELTIACAMILFAGASLAVVFYSGASARRSAGAISDSFHSARSAMEVMRREISSMFISAPNAEFDGIGLSYCGCGECGFDAGELKFYALLGGHSGEWDLCRVGYRHDAEKHEIQRLFNVNLHRNPRESWQPLVSNISGLEFYFSCTNGEEPVETVCWDTFSAAPCQKGRLPEMVRVIVKTRDAEELFEEREFSVNIAVPGSGRRVYVDLPPETLLIMPEGDGGL